MNSAPLPSAIRAQARAMFLNYLAAQNGGKVAVFETRDFMTDRPLNEPKFIGVAESKTAARNAFGFFYVGNNCEVISL
jgi:hypothetical protein